jgi:outer membrane protein TolC
MKTSTVKSRAAVLAAVSGVFRLALLLAATMSAAAWPLAAQSVQSHPIEFQQAIDLALKHSGVILAAQADRSRAAQRYQAERYAYYPTVIFGSGLGYSFGQPIAVAGQAPSVFNITHTQTLWNPASKESIKAAHSDYLAANIDYADRGEQVILDTALLYIELDSTQQRLAACQQQKQATDHALYIAQQREKEGVGSALDSKRAELDSARVDLRITELETNADSLRERLARTIGQPAGNLTTVTDTIPAAPPAAEAEDTSQAALVNSATVRAADERVRAAHFRARSQHKMNRPSIDFAGQYALLSNALNKYQDVFLYRHFSNSNYSFGMNFRVPVFNLSQNALAAAADAEALKAEAEAQNARDQVAADAVRAQQTVRHLEAVARVSRLELEVAQANIDAVKLETEEGHASARDQELARADIANRQVLLLESQFEYLRAQLQLLRQIGNLHQWALGK